MITVLIFIFVHSLLGGNGDAIRSMTESQRAIMILIIVASEINILVHLFSKNEK